MKTIVIWFEGLPQHWRLILSSLVTAASFVGGIIVSVWMKALLVGDSITFLVLAFFFVVLSTIIYLFKNAFVLAQDNLHSEIEQERQLVVQAHYHCAALTIEEIRRIRPESVAADSIETIRTFFASSGRIQSIIEAAFKAFETVYGRASRPDDRTDFEVTFMTRSYEDGKITIPACANRDGRDPRSMVLRKTDPDIYEGTETAKIYAASRPYVMIVEDTKAGACTYKELYSGETDRIRSSIISPVLSDKNELLGTIVVHCDRKNFFKRSKGKYWSDVMEVFTKRLAFEKRKLDLLVGSKPAQFTLPVPLPKPF